MLHTYTLFQNNNNKSNDNVKGIAVGRILNFFHIIFHFKKNKNKEESYIPPL